MKRVEVVKRQLSNEVFDKYEEDTGKMESDDIQLKEREEPEDRSEQYATHYSDSEYSSCWSFNFALNLICFIGMLYFCISGFLKSM